MSKWASIIYRDFHDVPRIFIVVHENRTYLFDAPFDEQLDEYRSEYEIYLMPSLTNNDLRGSWAGLEKRALQRLGSVPISAVRFDPTRRENVDLDALAALA